MTKKSGEADLTKGCLGAAEPLPNLGISPAKACPEWRRRRKGRQGRRLRV